MKRERFFIGYPFLIAAYGVLALASKNAAEVWPRDLVAPLALSMSVAAISLILCRLVIRERHVAGVLSGAVVVWFSCYGYIEGFLARQPWLQWLVLPDYGLPILLLVIGGIAYVLARKYAGALPQIARYLNISAAVLVAIPTYSLLQGWTRSASVPTHRSAPEIARPGRVKLAQRGPLRPDIYVIILDEYTGARSLEANFGFDNGPFEDSLVKMGFSVPRSPHSNYVHTHLALAAMLNWRLLVDRPRNLKAWNGAEAIDYAAIEDNRTWRYLRGLGYRFIFFPSAYPATRRNRFADLQLPEPSKVADEFGRVWSQTTMLIPAAELWCRTVGCGDDNFPYRPAPAELIDWKFEQLAQLPDSAGPLFVFAHLLLPHEPYIFNADCSHRIPLWPHTAEESNQPSAKAAYVEQIQCVNAKLLQLSSALIAKSQTPPIIVLQADHGHGRLGAAFATLRDAGRERVEERTEPFAAYYLPGNPVSVVYDSITPVNVLPRIFDHYFNAGIPLEPDATYWSTWQEPFDFVRVR